MSATHYQIEIDGNTYMVPAALESVTFERFVAFRKTLLGDPYELLSWYIGCRPVFKDTAKTEKQIAGTLALADVLVASIFDFMESNKKNKVPDSVRVLDVTVKLKRGLLQKLPYWPYAITKRIIERSAIEKDGAEGFDPTDKYSEVIAHYLYNAVTGFDYIESKASEFKEVIDKLPFTTCIQLGNFFLRRQRSLSIKERKRSLANRQTPTT